MAIAINATEPDPAGKLDLRRVLFELLVLCGMDRDLGTLRQVDQQGSPDAVADARLYLKRNPPSQEQEPRKSVDRYDRIGWVMVIVAQTFIVSLALLVFQFSNFGTSPLRLLVVAIVLFMCAALVDDSRRFQADLGNDGLFNTWLRCLAREYSRIARGKSVRSGLIDHHKAGVQYGTSHKALRRVTRYSALYPELWGKPPATYWVRIALLSLSGLLSLIAVIAFAWRGGDLPPLWPLYVIVWGLILRSEMRAQRNAASPDALRRYLIEHLINAIDSEVSDPASASPRVVHQS